MFVPVYSHFSLTTSQSDVTDAEQLIKKDARAEEIDFLTRAHRYFCCEGLVNSHYYLVSGVQRNGPVFL